MRSLLKRLIRPAALIDVAPQDIRRMPDPVRPVLLKIAAEALIRSDEADTVIKGIRARQGLGFIAPVGGPLVRRFFELRDLLPECPDPRDDHLRRQLDSILHHHALLLSLAMELLAYEWRSDRLGYQIDALDGMGAPAVMLEEIYASLLASSA